MFIFNNSCNGVEPLVTIIMPIYNAEEYIRDSVESIINQTYRNLEIICINDGSTDKTYEILSELMQFDNRIKIVSRKNKGLVYTLNEGISMACGMYIARMDADDISETSRIQRQVLYLNQHSDVAVLGTSCHIIDEFGHVCGQRTLAGSDYLIKGILYFGSPIIHPSVMFNAKLLGGDLIYNEKYNLAEDFELWCRLANKKYKMHNLKNKHIKYRIIKTSISRTNKTAQAILSKEIVSLYLLNGNKSINTKDGNFNIFLNIFFQTNKRYIPFQIVYFLKGLLKKVLK